MYSSGYSHVSKYSPQARKKMKQHSKGKSCGYYMRIVFFFSSLIQSLIIVSLVLFLIYGKDQDSALTTRIHDLEESHSRLSIENVALRQEKKNLTTFLNATLTEKACNDRDLAKLRDYTNASIVLIKDMDMRLMQCWRELMANKRCAPNPCPVCPNNPCNCGFLVDQLKAKLQLEESNFTQTVQRMRMDMEQTEKERDNVILEAIHLRREKSTHEKQLEDFRQKCKDDFTLSLSGVSSVSKAFLEKINSVFPSHIAFQLTCDKQREHLEQIRTNCSSLSREVEDRFQRYLNSVADQVSSIQAESSRMKAENWRLSEDYRWCSQNRTGLIQQNRQNQEKLQLKHDQEKEKLLMDKMKLHGEIDVLENNVNYKSKEVEYLSEKIKLINMSCMSKTGLNTFQGSTLQGGGPNLFNKPASGSSSSTGSFGSSAFNKPLLNGAGSFSSSGSSLPGSSSSTGLGSSKPAWIGGFFSSSSTGLGSNKPASTGLGSSTLSSSSLFGSSSSTGLGFNKPASTGSGSSSSSLFGSSSSTGLGSSKPASTGGLFSSSSSSSSGRGSSPSGSSPNLGIGGLGSNNPSSTGKSSSGFGSSSAESSTSSGSTSKSSSSSSGLGWFGFGGSSSGQSKTGSGTGKETSGGSGSSFGSGTTGRFGGGSVNVAQHLKDLQRLINPAVPEEKQDQSRMLG